MDMDKKCLFLNNGYIFVSQLISPTKLK